MQPDIDEVTEKRASMYPYCETKKNCTPLLACKLVSVLGAVGLSAEVPVALDVKVRAVWSTSIVDVIESSEAGRSGVLKYAYRGTCSCST